MHDTSAISFETLSDKDFAAVDTLSSKNKKSLGFFPKDAISEYIERNGVIGAKTDSGELLGYIMFARYPDRIRLAQVCVNESARGRGLARLLVEKLKASATTEKIIKLKCRRDYPAHSFWANVGFVAFDEQVGRSAEGFPLTLYGLVLDSSDELDLWRVEASESLRHCVIDAQIFFDFYESDSEKSIPAKSILNDFLADSLSLWIVDELFSEIDRQQNNELRGKSRKRAQGFQRIDYKRDLADSFEDTLKEILPSNTPNQLSDIRQLAKAAASDATVFISRDSRIIKLKDEVHARVGLHVFTPQEIITSVYREQNPELYSPSYISGLSLCWKTISDQNLLNIPIQKLLIEKESLGKFQEQFNSFLSQPQRYHCEALESEGYIVALRVTQKKELSSMELLDICCCRVIRHTKESLYASFMLADAIESAMSNRLSSVAISALQSSPTILISAQKIGFILISQYWIKPIIPQALAREEAISKLNTLLEKDITSLSDCKLEELASPLAINENSPTFLISIKPHYARQMIDREEAINELFIEKSSVLLRTDNVYYKKKSSHKMLQAPGRILWYVSGNNARVIAVSRLNEVSIDKAKNLFKKYSRFGVLDWRDIKALTGNTMNTDLMALRFSQTHSFRKSISRKQLLDICDEDNFNLALPSPTKIPYRSLRKLYNLGF